MRPKWHLENKPSARKRLYLRLLPHLRRVALRSGYALGLHGSLLRDLDLIAVPWRRGAVQPFTLADRLSLAACGLRLNRKTLWEEKPFGRQAIIICIGMHAHIDLSIVPYFVKEPTP